jgi:hypothetical protein
MIDVLDFAKRDEALDDGGYAFYVVDPDQMYPAMIDHATAVIHVNDMSLVARDQRGYVATLRPLGDLSAAAVHVDSATLTWTPARRFWRRCGCGLPGC